MRAFISSLLLVGLALFVSGIASLFLAFHSGRPVKSIEIALLATGAMEGRDSKEG